MDRLLASKDQRQLELIKIYRDQAELYLTHQELADRLDCAKGTILTDLADIEKLFADKIQICQSGAGVTLKFSEKLPTNFYFKRFSQQSVNFRLLVELFRESDISIDEMSQRLFVSRSSIYRAVKQINRFLQVLNLSLELTTSPVGIRGDERDIRLACPFLMNHFYCDTYCPFETISRQEVVDLFKIVSANSRYLQMFASNPLLYLQLGVNFERYAKGYKLEVSQWPISNRKLAVLMEGQELFANFVAQGQEYPLMEVIPQVVPGLLSSKTLLNRDHLLSSRYLNFEIQESIKKFEACMLTIKQDYQFQSVQESDIELIALAIYNLCTLSHRQLNIIMADAVAHQSNLIQEVACTNPQFVIDIQSAIQSFIDDLGVELPYHDEIMESLLFYFVVLWPDTILELNKIKKIDLLLYTGNYNYDLEYKAILDPIVHNYVTVHVIDSLIDWKEILADHKYQIIMSSYYVEATPDYHVFHIQSMPDVNTFLWIYETVRKINDSDTSIVRQFMPSKIQFSLK
ncbi:helix-turn-helix domain-containing protein [Hutsoniella sourekii]